MSVSFVAINKSISMKIFDCGCFLFPTVLEMIESIVKLIAAIATKVEAL